VRWKPCWETSPPVRPPRPQPENPARPLFLGLGAEAVARVPARKPFLTAERLAHVAANRMFFILKGKRELGTPARPYKEGLKDALTGFAKST